LLPVLHMVTVGAVLVVMLPAIRLCAQVADPVLGTWELNLAKSRYSPGPPLNVLKRIDAFILEATLKKAGTVVQTTTRVISNDGKTMTFTVKGTNANGQPFNNVLLWDKR